MQIMRSLNSQEHEIHIGCVPSFQGEPTAVGTVASEKASAVVVPLHPGPERPHGRSLQAIGAAARTWPPAAWSILRLIRHVRANDIKIIHTTDRPRDALLGVVVAKLTPARSVVHVHVLFADWMGRSLQWAIRNADARIAVSEFVRQSLLEAGIDAASTHAVLNAVDIEKLQPQQELTDIRAEFDLDSSQPLVVTVCRLFPEKGPEMLIRAIDALRNDLPDVQLLIVGEDNDPAQAYRSHLDRLVTDLDLNDHVRFTGRRPDVPAFMAAADVFAMPSFEEPFGLVFAEAMAMETPVVALDNGGTREVVEHNEHGLLSAPGDLDALVAHLRKLLTDDDLRRRLGTNGRNRVLEDFQVERLGTDTAAVYRLVA